MHKLLVVNDKLKGSNDNKIIIDKDKVLEFEYINCKDIKLEFQIEDNCNVEIYHFYENDNVVINNNYVIKANCSVKIISVHHDKKVVDNEIINLNGEGSTIDNRLITIASGYECYHFIINHNCNNCVSNVINKAVTVLNGEVKFIIDSDLKCNVKNSVLNQESRVITNNVSKCEIRPNLFIKNNMVMARHGSSIGQFDDSELFYLMSRGIKKEDAIKLLVKGFVFADMELDISKREKILKMINLYWR